MTDESNERSGGERERVPDDCFEGWLYQHRDDPGEVGRVARWVFKEIHAGRWPYSQRLHRRQDYWGDELRIFLNFVEASVPEEYVQMFLRVYEQYGDEGPGGRAYDRKVEEVMKRIDESLGEDQNPEESRDPSTGILGTLAEDLGLALWVVEEANRIHAERLAEGIELDPEELLAAVYEEDDFRK